MVLLRVSLTIGARNLIRSVIVHDSDFEEYYNICCKLGELKPLPAVDVRSNYITCPIPTNVTIERYGLRLTNNS